MKQNINYIGSKYRLLDFIDCSMKSIVGDFSDKIFCDLFAGTGIVSRYFENKCNLIISNDIELYSYVLLKAYLCGNKFDTSFLNSFDGRPGFIFDNYSESGSAGRNYFSEYNGKKIDTIREQIGIFPESSNEFFVSLAALLEASDKVANTTSVYGAYLKHIKLSAQRKLNIENLDKENKRDNVVFNEDALTLINKIDGDILYLDPPYNSRQYSGNYHLLNTICKYDKFSPIGVTGQRPDNNSSMFCSKVNCFNSFEEIIKNSNFKYIFVSYSNEGLMPSKEIRNCLEKYGRYNLFEKEIMTYKADSNRANKSSNVIENIHFIEKF